MTEFDQIVARGRFFELFGYALVVLSFAILSLGVSWAVSKRFGPRRAAFLAATWGAVAAVSVAAFALLVATSPWAVPNRPIRNSNPPVTNHTAASTPQIWKTVEVQIDIDGQACLNGQPIDWELALRPPPPESKREPPLQLHVILIPDKETPMGLMTQAMHECRSRGVDNLTIQSPDETMSTSAEP